LPFSSSNKRNTDTAKNKRNQYAEEGRKENQHQLILLEDLTRKYEYKHQQQSLFYRVRKLEFPKKKKRWKVSIVFFPTSLVAALVSQHQQSTLNILHITQSFMVW